jgi:outer membrane protein OmpA-like peptidoglycan-associated protein
MHGLGGHGKERAMKNISLVLVSAAFVLAGCQTGRQPVPPPPAPPPPPPPGVQQPVQAPVTSAGPLTKASVGTYMDAQESDLRQLLRGQGVTVARRGDVLLVTVPSDNLFEHLAIGAWGAAFVRGVSEVLAHYDHTLIEVDAYTDTTGREEQNLSLSQKRAQTLADAFKQNGVAASRLTAAGYGATNPKISNGKDPRNRRVEIKIVPAPRA